jgi:hypothetical protein
LQRQRAAGEKGGEANHRQGEPADVKKLVRQFARVPGRAEDVADEREEVERDAARSAEKAEDRAAHDGERRGEEAGHGAVSARL